MFSGYGGLDEAVRRVVGGRVVWHCEWEPPSKVYHHDAAAQVLAHRYPDVPNLGDVTRVDWSSVEPVDVLTAGFPCQDLSLAGPRAGLVPGTRSGLWASVVDAIAALHPSMVIIENVRGLLNARARSDVEPCPWCLGDPGREPPLRALGAVLGDLASLGFDAEWTGLRAADIGCAHGRFRVFILAVPCRSAGDADLLDGEGWDTVGLPRTA